MRKLSKKAKTKGLAALLSLLLVFSVVPIPVVQAEPETDVEEESDQPKEDMSDNGNQKPGDVDKPDDGNGDDTTNPDKPSKPDNGNGDDTLNPDNPDRPDDGNGGDNTTNPDNPDKPDDGNGDDTTNSDNPDKLTSSDDKDGDNDTILIDKTEQVTISGNGEDIRKAEEDADVEVTDEVFFNTGSHVWQIVNEEAFTEGEIGDGCFEEDGSYTIYIPEPNPFFPYEVQFTYGDKVENCWFMNPEDSVSIGGHTFYVAAEFDDSALIRMNLNVGGDEIIVYPEEKEFTDDGEGISVYSLQPLEERRLQSIDLKAYTPVELTMVSVDYIFQNGETDDADNVVWKKAYDSGDDYNVSAKGDKLDLSWGTSSSSSNTWEMIVGSADQLDTENIRYIVPIETTVSNEWLLPTVYQKDQEENKKYISPRKSRYYDSYGVGGERGLDIYLGSSQISDGDTVYITLGINSSVFSSTQYHELKVFDDVYEKHDITEEICHSGYAVQFYGYGEEQLLTMVTYDENGEETGHLLVELDIRSENDGNSLSPGWIYEKNGTGWHDISYSRSYSTVDGCRNYTTELYAEYPADNTYYLRNMTYYQSGESNSSAVTAAYAGQYDSIVQAVSDGADNIKEQLFNSSADGYAADYSQGVYFTVFVGEDGTEQEIYRYCIKTETGTRPERTSSSATNIRFNGLKDAQGNVVNTYIAQSGEWRDDSYGDSNFYTILVENTVDLTKLAPEFSTASGINLYADNVPQVSGESMHDFSNGAVQYTASAENKEDQQNYWLQVVPVNSGRKLYINSLNDEGANTREENGVIYSTREILLDGNHDYRHDILLINTGTQDIDNLGVALESNSVELDEYWTLSGANKLSAVTNVDKNTSYGELANMAKIRLKLKLGVPLGSDVEGTLTIKSGSDVLMVLTLTGTVGNPCIITKEIPQAVKYVPYGVMIQNNNKYKRNKVSYKLLSGSLPNGLEVKPNGELYGVPTEAGEYTFTVSMMNSLSSFSDSEKTYTLTVLDNTDANVDSATDTGYDLTQRVVGANVSESGSQTLVSEGEYAEFQYVFLDGVMLAEGSDYTSEAGSTRITIRNQTLALSSGTHTIGIEFRTQDEDNILNRAAQNYVIAGSSSDDDHGSGNHGSGSSGSDSGGSTNNGSDNSSGDGTNEGADAGISSTAGGSGNAGQDGGNALAGGRGNAGQTGTAGQSVMLNMGTPISYMIQSGDTLWTIAEKYYGLGALWQKIYADNAATISNPDKIYVGQIIMLYPGQGEGLAGMASTVSTAADITSVMGESAVADGSTETGTYYTVEAGDTLWKIARKVYGRGWQWRKIHKANQDQITDPAILRIGQVIFIPE